MVRLLDAIDIEKFSYTVGDLDIFDYNYNRLKMFLKNMVYVDTPKNPQLLFDLLGLARINIDGIVLDGIDVGNVIIERMRHLHYNDEKIIIDERPLSDLVRLISFSTNGFFELEPSKFQFLIAKGDDNTFYFSLFSSKFGKED